MTVLASMFASKPVVISNAWVANVESGASITAGHVILFDRLEEQAPPCTSPVTGVALASSGIMTVPAGTWVMVFEGLLNMSNSSTQISVTFELWNETANATLSPQINSVVTTRNYFVNQTVQDSCYRAGVCWQTFTSSTNISLRVKTVSIVSGSISNTRGEMHITFYKAP